MVKIERNPVPPPSLAVEKQKATGVYNKSDVILRLKEDSHDKCYICGRTFRSENKIIILQYQSLQIPVYQAIHQTYPQRGHTHHHLRYSEDHDRSRLWYHG